MIHIPQLVHPGASGEYRRGLRSSTKDFGKRRVTMGADGKSGDSLT